MNRGAKTVLASTDAGKDPVGPASDELPPVVASGGRSKLYEYARPFGAEEKESIELCRFNRPTKNRPDAEIVRVALERWAPWGDAEPTSYIAFRVWYKSAPKGCHRPSSRAVVLRADELADMIRGLTEAARRLGIDLGEGGTKQLKNAALAYVNRGAR